MSRLTRHRKRLVGAAFLMLFVAAQVAAAARACLPPHCSLPDTVAGVSALAARDGSTLDATACTLHCLQAYEAPPPDALPVPAVAAPPPPVDTFLPGLNSLVSHAVARESVRGGPPLSILYCSFQE